jgi:hypothetical protein
VACSRTHRPATCRAVGRAGSRNLAADDEPPQVKPLRFGLDGAAVLVFVAIGRSVHRHGLDLGGIASTLWPFAVGLGCGWLVVLATRQSPAGLREGAEIAAVTVALGMMLRVISGQGTAVAFIFVALGFLGAAMMAWRVIAWAARRGFAKR